jgi:hypothetical protein
MNQLLINKWMPQFHTTDAHSISIASSPHEIYYAVRNLEMKKSLIIRVLFSLRSFDFTFSRKENALGLTFEDLLKSGFILLEENPPTELVLGLVGKFWTTSGCIEHMNDEAFSHFDKRGYTTAVWNFHLDGQPNGETILSTETRVFCTDDVSRTKFLRYWFLIGPFSGLIRKAMLRTIKRQVET